MTISDSKIKTCVGRNIYSINELEKIYKKLYSNSKFHTHKIQNKLIKSVRKFEIQTIKEQEAKTILNKYHYLPTHNFVGRRICYRIIDSDTSELLALSIWANTPAPSLEARDKYLKFKNHKERVSGICKICANNVRFLILPYVQVPNLASMIISKVIKQLKSDWYYKYGDKLEYVETFVDPSLGFKGTCYLASNWKKIGMTKGYSFHGTGYTGMKGFYKMPKCNTKKIILFKVL